MSKEFRVYSLFLLLVCVCPALAQELTFTHIPLPKSASSGVVKNVVRDPQGIMWISQQGLYRYDGYHVTSYFNDPQNPNSLADNAVECMYAGHDGLIWIGTAHHGLDQFDPATGQFTHFRHKPNDPASLSNDIVQAIVEDRDGTLWVGTRAGLNRLDRRTNTFTCYRHNPADPVSLSHDHIRALYQDRQGTIWVGCQMPVVPEDGIMKHDGGLNRFNARTGTFTQFLHDPNDPHSLMDNRVRAIFEDSRGTFWVGTAGDGLHTMDRVRGTFTRHRYDPAHPEKLSRPPLKKTFWWADDHITFITEDKTGAIWIGTMGNGLNRYDPRTNQVKHFPNFKDPESGVQTATPWSVCASPDGLLWIGYIEGLFLVDPLQQTIPYVATSRPVRAICQDKVGVIWYGTDRGLVRKDPTVGTERRFVHNAHNPQSLSNDTINAIYEDRQGILWIGTHHGLNRFDPHKPGFTRYLWTKPNDSRSINYPIQCMYEDRKGVLWIGTHGGLYRMDRQAGSFTRYVSNPNDTTSLGSNRIISMYEDRSGNLWVGAIYGGLNRMVGRSGKFQRFLRNEEANCLLQDSDGILWVGTKSGLYRSNRALTGFSPFTDSTDEQTGHIEVRGLLEDHQKTLWVYGSADISRLNRQRNHLSLSIPFRGQQSANDHYASSKSTQSRQGKLFFAAGNGYYAFFPSLLSRKAKAPQVILSALRINNEPVVPGPQSPLKAPLGQTNEIRLSHNQNSFSFDFAGIQYINPERNIHLFWLEGLDNTWRKAGEEKTAYFYNVPPDTYTFRIKVVNEDGGWAEKAIRVIIAPPWWRTWWFVTLATTLMLGSVLVGFRYRVAQIRQEAIQKTEFTKKLSEMEMQALRAQMNPHFIFNSLNSINTFILKNEPEAASDYLTKFSRLIRLILQNSNSAAVTLQKELEALQLVSGHGSPALS